MIGLKNMVALFAVLMFIGFSSEHTQAQPNQNKQAIRVEVVKPERRSLAQSLHLPGTLAAGERVDLFAKTSGYIGEVLVDIGSRVKKHDKLVVLDIPEMTDTLRQAEAVLESTRAKVGAMEAKASHAQSMITTAEAAVTQFQAELDLSRNTVRRKKELLEAKAIPDQDYDEAQTRLAVVEAQIQNAQAHVESTKADKQSADADVEVAKARVAVEQANVARLRTLMEYSTIRAPFDGVVTARMVDPGDFVRSATQGDARSLVTVVNDGFIRLVIEVPESDVPFVHVGTKLEVQSDALGKEPMLTEVVRTAGALKEQTRTMRVEAQIDNSNHVIIPGLYARVAVHFDTKQQAMMIPSKAVRAKGKEISVLVAEGGVARAKPITLGYDDGIWAEVRSGLTGDEQVIVAAAGAVVDGAAVKAIVSGSSS